MKLAFRVLRFGTKFIGGVGGGQSTDDYLGTRSDDVVNDGVVLGIRRGLLMDFLLFILFFLYLSKELNVSSIGISLLFLLFFSFASRPRCCFSLSLSLFSPLAIYTRVSRETRIGSN